MAMQFSIHITVSDLLRLLANGIVALLAAWIAVKMSFRQYSSQKWWDRQEATYSEIVATLSEILIALGQWEDDIIGERKFDPDERAKRFAKLKDSREKIERVAREGAFRISERSAKALKELWSALGQERDHEYDSMAHHWDSVTVCLKIINEEARRELRIGRSWYKRFV